MSNCKISNNNSSSAFKTFLKVINENSDFPAKYILLTLASSFLLILFNIMPAQISLAVCTIFAVYFNSKNFEVSEKTNVKQWLGYWLIFSLNLIFESIFSIDNRMFASVYYFFKTVFFSFMFLPYFNGAEIIYSTFLERLIKRFVNLNRLKFYYDELIRSINVQTSAAKSEIKKGIDNISNNNKNFEYKKAKTDTNFNFEQSKMSSEDKQSNNQFQSYKSQAVEHIPKEILEEAINNKKDQYIKKAENLKAKLINSNNNNKSNKKSFSVNQEDKENSNVSNLMNNN